MMTTSVWTDSWEVDTEVSLDVVRLLDLQELDLVLEDTYLFLSEEDIALLTQEEFE